MAEPTISAVIVDYRKAARVVENVRSLRRQYPAERLDIVVIDNSVDTENARTLRALDGEPGVRLIVNATNTGYTAACNQGAAIGTGDFVLLVNPDILWSEPGALRRLAAFMRDRPNVAIAGPRQINEDGTVPRTARRFPSIVAQCARRSTLGKLPGFSRSVENYEGADLDYRRTQPVDWLQSSCVLVRRDFWNRIGGLDERYFLFMADCVLCWQAWDERLEVVHFADAAVTADGIRASAGGALAVFRSAAARHHLRDAFLYHLRHLGRYPAGRRPAASLAMPSLQDTQPCSCKIANHGAPAP